MRAVPSRVYTLGPAGTFSDKAAQRLIAHLLGGSGAAQTPAIVYTATIPEVLTRSEGDPQALGVIPIENSDTGTVTFAQDSLVRHKVRIQLEINVRVSFSLLAGGPLEAVQTVYSHPVARDQCALFLARHFPQAEIAFTHSNTESGNLFLRARKKAARAAIVPADYGEAHKEYRVACDIQNYSDNFTRFLVLRETTSPAGSAAAPDFTRGKTSLLIEPKADYPGLLYELLSVFYKYRLNLCRLESRPQRAGPWTYVFFLDVTNNENTAACLAELENGERKVTVLGSFDTLEGE